MKTAARDAIVVGPARRTLQTLVDGYRICGRVCLNCAPTRETHKAPLGCCLGRYEGRAGRFPIVKPKESGLVWVKISASIAG